MKYIIFLPCVAAMIVFGYFVMKKIDSAVDENENIICGQDLHSRESVRIAFENPFSAASVCGVLEAFSKKHPMCAVYLFCGSRGQIKELLSEDKINIGVFSSDAVETGHNEIIIAPKNSEGCILPEIAPIEAAQRGKALNGAGAMLAEELLEMLRGDF